MNTPTPSDPRALAHRLTTVGHALHHRLFAQLHDSGIHPKTLLLLSAVDGRIDAPWVLDRLARGGKRVTALSDRGWIVRDGDGWSLTDEGRALLDRVDAERSALLADVPAEQLENLTAALDALAATLDVDDAETTGRGPRGGFRVIPGVGRHGFGPDPRRAFGPNEHRGFRVGERGVGPPPTTRLIPAITPLPTPVRAKVTCPDRGVRPPVTRAGSRRARTLPPRTPAPGGGEHGPATRPPPRSPPWPRTRFRARLRRRLPARTRGGRRFHRA